MPRPLNPQVQSFPTPHEENVKADAVGWMNHVEYDKPLCVTRTLGLPESRASTAELELPQPQRGTKHMRGMKLLTLNGDVCSLLSGTVCNKSLDKSSPMTV